MTEDFIQSNLSGFYFGKDVFFDAETTTFKIQKVSTPTAIFFGPYTNLASGKYELYLKFEDTADFEYQFYVYANAVKYVIANQLVKANQDNVIAFEIDSLKIKNKSLEYVMVSPEGDSNTIKLNTFMLNTIELKSNNDSLIPSKIQNQINEKTFYSINNALTDLEQSKILLGYKQEIVRNAALEPSLEEPTSQLCTASQFYSPVYQHWCGLINEQPRLHRKQWEFVFIMQSLQHHGMLGSDKQGIGFGCGKEPLPSLMAKLGCKVVATDIDLSTAKNKGWVQSNQHSGELKDLYFESICDKTTFDSSVSFRNVDMNKIPKDLQGFDFTWSACAFEHLGSIEKGLEFVINSVKCLKPGGIAVHTTEFNLSSNDDTFESKSCVFFRKQDIERLIVKLKKMGCTVMPLNLVIGDLFEDGFVDLPPYKAEPHLKLAMQGYITTSIGLIIRRLNDTRFF